jgi:hypothetical protein
MQASKEKPKIFKCPFIYGEYLLSTILKEEESNYTKIGREISI